MTTQIHLTTIQVSGYLDGELSREERAEIEQHLDQCDACRLELAEVDMLAHPKAVRGASRRRIMWLIGGVLAASIAGIAVLRPGSVREPQDRIERPSLTPGETLPR